MKDIKDIIEDFGYAVDGSYELNSKVQDDIKFAFVDGNQWSGSYNDNFRGRPKPENNQVRIAVNRLLGQYDRQEFNAKIMSDSDDATDEDAELLQARWRNDYSKSLGFEAYHNAALEAFTGGFGAFKLTSKFEDEETPDVNRQYLCVEPIYSAASSVVFNAGALRKDKADAKQCWQLLRVNRRETENEYDVTIKDFPEATNSSLEWLFTGNNRDTYIAHYWEVIEQSYTVFVFDDYKIEKRGRKYFDENNEEIEKDLVDSMKESIDYTQYKRKVKEVWHAIIDGEQFITKPQKTPFKRIPVIPQYGYWTVVDGKEYYTGIATQMKDPQMFMNMYFGALMEILGERQTSIPEYAPEQLADGLGWNIANEKKNNAAYRITNPALDGSGNPVHFGPVGMVAPPEVGSGLMSAGQYLTYAQDLQGGTGQSTLPANASAEAVKEINQRADDVYQPLFQNAIQSIRALCMAWIPAAQKLYFTQERELRVVGEDGSVSQVRTLEYTEKDGQYGPFKNTAKGRYDVTVKAGESYQGKKEAERKAAMEILQYTDTASPIGQMALNTAILSTTGEGTQDMRRIARMQNLRIMLTSGIEPDIKTDEEAQFVQMLMQQMQQPQQPDANTLLAQAEMEKAKADQMDAEVKAFDAETKRMKVMVDAEKVGAEINNKDADTMNKMLDAESKAMSGLQLVKP